MAAKYMQRQQFQRLAGNVQHEHEPVKDLFRTVPRSKRVQNWVERNPAGMIIDIASAGLSLLTVVTYMVETHYPNDSSAYLALRNVDLACCAAFALEWLFWLWLAQHRLRYILSLQSLVDLLTIGPTAASSLVNTRVPGLNTVEAMVRVLRVLRVFRIFRVVHRLHSEVQARLLMLACTLAAIIVTAAALFYEIETRFGTTYPDLTIERSIYWGAVTITTIGYGDYSPSVLGSQMMVIGILIITFTVLPYQSNALVGSLSESNPYRAARYSTAGKGRHVVITGHLDAGVMQLLVEELYHDDYGFHDYSLVFLRPTRPSRAMQRLLKVHRMNHRLRYLQGSATSHTDLARAQVHAADAVFLMADKSPVDAHEEDLKNSTCCLAIGQFVYAMACTNSSSQRQAGWGLMSLITLPNWLRQHHHHHPTTPLMCIQLLLPESRQRLTSWLQRYSAPNAPGHNSRIYPPMPGSHQQQQEQGHPPSENTCSNAARFWQGFVQSLAVVCAAEISCGLMGAACLAPGVITLLSNLVRSVDSNSLSAAELAQLPNWAHQYLAGAAHELYEVPLLPRHLWGHSVATVTRYLQQHHAAITIATAGSLPPSSRQPPANNNEAPTAAAPPSASSSSEDVQTSRQLLGVLGRGGMGGSRDCRPVWLAPLDHQVLPGTTLYVIAQDLRVVLDIMQDSPVQFQKWLKLQQQEVKMGLLVQACEPADQQQQPDQQASSSWLLSPSSPRGLQQPLLQQHPVSGKAAATSSTAAAQARQLPTVVAPAGVLQVTSMPTHSSSVEAEQPHSTHSGTTSAAAACPAGQQDVSLQQHCTASAAAGLPMARNDSSTVLDIPQLQAQQEQLRSHGGTSSTGSLPHGRNGQPAAAAVQPEAPDRPGSQCGGSAAAQHCSDTHHRHHHHHHHHDRQAVQLNTHALAAPSHSHVSGRAMALRSRAALQSHAGQQLRQARSSGRRGDWQAAGALQQKLYHTRQLCQDADPLQEACAGEVQLSGHILVAANGVQPDALLALLAPLRSRSLDQARLAPVVLLDAAAQPDRLGWADIARLSDVFIIKGSVHDIHTLMAANAEQATVGVLLQSWCSSTSGGCSSCAGCADDSSVSSAGLDDARVLAAANTLRSVNPNIQLFVELGQYSSLALLSPSGSLLGWQAAESSGAAATPAFMAGQVLLPAMLDAMVCQTLYNLSTPRIVSQLLSQWHAQLGGQPNPCDPSAADAAEVVAEAAAPGSDVQGNTELTNGVSTQQAPHSKQSHAASATAHDSTSKQQQGATGILQHAGGAVMLQVPVAECGGCATFGSLFGWLLAERGMVAVALYRQAQHQGSSLQYVYTNPDQDTELCATDSALVLLPHTAGASQLPIDACHSWQQVHTGDGLRGGGLAGHSGSDGRLS